MPTFRRTIALTAAALSLAAGVAVTTSGSAQASSGPCAYVSAYGTTGSNCLGTGGSDVWVSATQASTDVRIYAWLYDSCGTHTMPSYVAEPGHYYHNWISGCSGPRRTHMEITESGRNVSEDWSSWQ
jgi:hypothetical protein